MKLIICLDDCDGLLFNGRRQSKDSILRKRILAYCGEAILWMNSYTASQFEELPESVCVDECFLDKAGAEDYCFAENVDIVPYLDRISGVVLYRWNRRYPADVYAPLGLLAMCKNPSNCIEFEGSSHKKIREEIYAL